MGKSPPNNRKPSQAPEYSLHRVLFKTSEILSLLKQQNLHPCSTTQHTPSANKMTTIWSSFSQALPQFPQLGDQVEIRLKDSGTTSAKCTPPRCGINISVQHWVELAYRLSLDQHSNQLKAKYLPGIENIDLKSEADVVKVSTLYLTHPVHIAYQLVHPGDRQLDELIKPQKRTTPSSRCDRAYFSGRADNENTPGNSTNVFAILEYKKFGGLSRDHFRLGMVLKYEDYARAVTEPPFHRQESRALVVLKQATHYAARFNTPFVALCDYNTLILLVMTEVEDFSGGPVSTYDYSVFCRKDSLISFLSPVHLHDRDRGLQNDAEGVSGVPLGGQVALAEQQGLANESIG